MTTRLTASGAFLWVRAFFQSMVYIGLGEHCVCTGVLMAYAQLLSCFFGSKILFIKRGTAFSMICKSITKQFCQDRGDDKEKETDRKRLLLSRQRLLNNVAKSDFCCLETAFLRGRNVSLETGFEGFNHKRKDRVSQRHFDKRP